MRLAAEHEVVALLERLGVPRRPPSVDYLACLQRAWGLCQPFHNLDLLAGYARGEPALTRRNGWLRCVDGLGGPCHVQASSFLALLNALGFDAHFAAASIAHPGDHLVVWARVDGRDWLCDVGNGHPYLTPFPLGETCCQEHLGWRVRTSLGSDGLVLKQQMGGAEHWRLVYVASPQRRSWADFEAAITQHHTQRSFGPFLTGLRAIRVREHIAHTLRDDVFTTHTPKGFDTVVLQSGHEKVLTKTMGMAALPVELAVATWRRNRGRSD